MPVAVGDVADAVLAERGGPERVAAVAVDLGHDAAAEGEGGEGVVVCEEDHGVDELRQGPAVLLSLHKLLGIKNNKRDISESATEQRSPTYSNLYARASATFRPCPAAHLDVFLGQEPRSVGQDFVELPERLQLPRGFVQAV